MNPQKNTARFSSTPVFNSVYRVDDENQLDATCPAPNSEQRNLAAMTQIFLRKCRVNIGLVRSTG